MRFVMNSLKNLRGRKSVLILIGLSFVYPALVQAQASSDLSREKILFTVGYAHLDTQWRWDYQKTIKEYIWKTMVDNFSLFEK